VPLSMNSPQFTHLSNIDKSPLQFVQNRAEGATSALQYLHFISNKKHYQLLLNLQNHSPTIHPQATAPRGPNTLPDATPATAPTTAPTLPTTILFLSIVLFIL